MLRPERPLAAISWTIARSIKARGPPSRFPRFFAPLSLGKFLPLGRVVAVCHKRALAGDFFWHAVRKRVRAKRSNAQNGQPALNQAGS
jgi:hypothetical protein